MTGVLYALDAHLIDDWRKVALRYWSVRIALFWGCVSGLLTVWPAFADAIPLWAYAAGSVAMTGAIAIARVTKQPGVD